MSLVVTPLTSLEVGREGGSEGSLPPLTKSGIREVMGIDIYG